MFVYQTSSNTGGQEASARRRVEGYFNIPERWADKVTQNSVIVVLCAFLFGGISKVVTLVPMAAFIGTIFVLAWVLGDSATADEPKWVNQLSLASTGLLYLGLGHCIGLAVCLLVPVALMIIRPE